MHLIKRQTLTLKMNILKWDCCLLTDEQQKHTKCDVPTRRFEVIITDKQWSLYPHLYNRMSQYFVKTSSTVPLHNSQKLMSHLP